MNEKIQELSLRLKNATGPTLNNLEIYACAMEILELNLGDDYDFPIDVVTIVNKLGITLAYQSLNERANHNYEVSRFIKRQNRINGETILGLIIDNKIPKNIQRFAIARAIAIYLYNFDEKRFSKKECTMPMLTTEIEEIAADYFASYLTLPCQLFLDEFSSYVGDEQVPNKTSEWLEYLSIVSKLPYEQACIGYQNIRNLCEMILQHEKSELSKYSLKVQDSLKDKKYQKIF